MRTTKRRIKVLAGALAACAASALLGAGTAGADVGTITLEHGYLKVSGPSGEPAPSKIVDDDPADGLNPVVLTVNYDAGMTSGAFTLAEEVAANFDFPAYEGVLDTDLGALPVELDFAPIPTGAGDITGSYNAATGAISFAGDPVKYMSTASFSVFGNPATCVIQPITLGLSTANTSPFVGDPFESGPPPANGAIAAAWTGLPAPIATDPADQEYCTLLGSFTSKCGGTWLSNGTVTGPPGLVAQPGCGPAADDPVTTTTKKKICKKGQKKKKGKCVKKKKKKKKK